MKKYLVLFALVFSATCFAQFGSQDSGGNLIPEEACYDVLFYNINLTIDPDDQVIGGYVIMRAAATKDFSKIIVDLDSVYNVESVLMLADKESYLDFVHAKGKILIKLREDLFGMQW